MAVMHQRDRRKRNIQAKLGDRFSSGPQFLRRNIRVAGETRKALEQMFDGLALRRVADGSGNRPRLVRSFGPKKKLIGSPDLNGSYFLGLDGNERCGRRGWFASAG